MKKINLAISGCMGRMGQQLIKSSKKNKNFKLVTLTENRLINKKFNGVKPELNSEKAFKKAILIKQSPNFVISSPENREIPMRFHHILTDHLQNSNANV